MIGPISSLGWATGLFQTLSNPVQGFKSACQMSGEMAGQGGVTSESLVKDSLKQIAHIDQGLQGGNAFVETNPDARKEAKARDHERAKGHVRGYLHGVPIALKDVFETKDRMQTSAGSKALVGAPIFPTLFVHPERLPRIRIPGIIAPSSCACRKVETP